MRTDLAYWVHTSKGPPVGPSPRDPPSRISPQPDLELLDRLVDAGPVRLVTLAPELPGASALIERLLHREIAVSCEHSDATADQANAAFDLGVRSVTHLFNAMRPFHHRDPGVAGAALARPTRGAADRRLGARRSGHRRDGVASRTGPGCTRHRCRGGRALEDGTYRLGDVSVEISDGVARGATGALAGSTLTMIDAIRNLHSLGVPLETRSEPQRKSRPGSLDCRQRDGSGSGCRPTSSFSATTSWSSGCSSRDARCRRLTFR